MLGYMFQDKIRKLFSILWHVVTDAIKQEERGVSYSYKILIQSYLSCIKCLHPLYKNYGINTI